jgi:hypothetical protein
LLKYKLKAAADGLSFSVCNAALLYLRRLRPLQSAG